MKTLLQKLGYKPGTPALVWRLPETLSRGELGTLSEGEEPTFRLAFVHTRAELAEAAEEVARSHQPGGHLWFAYPKQSGAIHSDISRDHGWEALAALNLLPVTQIALDADWSALRFRRREEIARLTRRSER